MKKLFLMMAVMLFTVVGYGQIYEGFAPGMSKDEAKKEFKSNKDKYTAVDLGNGWVWRLYHQNFKYDDQGGLVGVYFTPKGGALGVSYDNTIGFLNQTKLFFDRLGYETILKQDFWNAPHNFKGTYGLLMHDPDKKRVIQMFPLKAQNMMIPNLVVHDYDYFMEQFQAQSEELDAKADETGF
jgi:hypothetical protein